MAHFWRRQESGDWAAVGIDTALFRLVGDFDGPAARDPGAISVPALCGSGSGPHAEEWLLLSPPGGGVAVNGRRLQTGLVALRDRDEIRLASGERDFFSTESLAVVEPFAAAGAAAATGGAAGGDAVGHATIRCPRCRRPIEPGSPVVRCPAPGCGVVHHESDELPCWTYAERCSLCPQQTQLGSDQRWTPEGL